MNFKTTYILFGALALLLGLLALVLYLGPSAPPEPETLFPTMHTKTAKLKPGDVTKIVIERKKPVESDIVLERVDEKHWKITSPRVLTADASRVTTLIDNVMGAKNEPLKAPKTMQGGGLDSPSRIVKVITENREWTLTIGEVLPGEESAVAFVTSSDRPGQPLAVSKRSIESVLETVNYFRNKDLLGDGTSDIRAVKLSQPKKETVELKKEKDNWHMVQPPYGDVDIGSLLTNITNLRPDYRSEKDNDFIKEQATDLAAYGLNPAKDPVLRVEITRGEGKSAVTQTLLIGKKDGGKYFAAADTGKPAKDVVKVPMTDVEEIVKVLDDPSKYRNKNLVVLDNFREPDAIDIQNSYGKLEFRRSESAKPTDKTWHLYRDKATYNVDDIEVRKLIDELKKKDVVGSFPDAKRRKELGFEKPQATVWIYADSLEKPNPKAKDAKPAFKKDTKPVAELRFGNVERDQVAVERVWGGETTLVMVPQSLFDQVRKGPLAYVDKSIPGYNPGPADENVTRVDITRGGETIEITRGSDKKWKIAKPANLKDRLADDGTVSDILNRLNHLQAKEVYDEKADAKELANLGLTNPTAKVTITVTKDKKPTTHEYIFGKEEPGKGVFVKLGNKDTIYRVGPEVMEMFKREVRDTTVLNFEPDKVTAVKIKGWKNVVGSTLTRAFAQKDGKWTATDPADFPLDTTKLGDFVSQMSRLKAERFLPTGSTLKTDNKVLQIEITLADKKVIDLTIGVEEGIGYQAASNQLKGDVFIVSKSIFEQVRDKPAYFSK